MSVRWEAAGASDTGRVRTANEDAFLIDEERGVFLVADGMGGHAAGEVASALATAVIGGTMVAGVDARLEPADLHEALRASFRAAHEAILGHQLEDPATVGMGTTMTCLVVQPDGTFRLGHIGDSRMYLLRDGLLTQVSRDHTWVQREVDAGRLTALGARRHRLAHVLTRALGADSADEPDVVSGKLLAGDLVLLATDGLTGMLTDRVIAALLEAGASLEQVAEALLDAANRRGGRDNITAVVVRILEGDETATA